MRPLYAIKSLFIELICIEYIVFFIADCDGIFISNGPGNPQMCSATIDGLRRLLQHPKPKPVFGICLGNQLLALAAGCTTYKLKYI